LENNFDNFIDDLQNQIYHEMRETYGEIVFQRWMKLLYQGRIELPDGYGCVTGSCGDTMEIFLRFKKNRVKEASFQTDGCGTSAVCGSFAAELARGKTPDELLNITGETILEILGGLPREDRHCAFLAADTLHESLDNYMKHLSRNEKKRNVKFRRTS